MSETQITLRMPDELLERADRLAPLVKEAGGELALGRVSRAFVLKLAISRGLAQLEHELEPGPVPPKRKR